MNTSLKVEKVLVSKRKFCVNVDQTTKNVLMKCSSYSCILIHALSCAQRTLSFYWHSVGIARRTPKSYTMSDRPMIQVYQGNKSRIHSLWHSVGGKRFVVKNFLEGGGVPPELRYSCWLNTVVLLPYRRAWKLCSTNRRSPFPPLSIGQHVVKVGVMIWGILIFLMHLWKKLSCLF